MKETRQIREQLSLSQVGLAGLLGVSRSAITMYEMGRRSLPFDATIKLGELIIAKAQAEQNKIHHVQIKSSFAEKENTTRLVKELQQKADECRAMAAQVLQQLQAMQEQYNKMIFQANLIGTWMNNTATGTKARLYYEIQEEELFRKIIPIGLQEQFTLQQQADILLSNAAAYENALDKLDRGEV